MKQLTAETQDEVRAIAPTYGNMPAESKGTVYTPEAQIEALVRIAQAAEKVASILAAWDNGARVLSVRVSNLKYF